MCIRDSGVPLECPPSTYDEQLEHLWRGDRPHQVGRIHDRDVRPEVAGRVEELRVLRHPPQAAPVQLVADVAHRGIDRGCVADEEQYGSSPWRHLCREVRPAPDNACLLYTSD